MLVFFFMSAYVLMLRESYTLMHDCTTYNTAKQHTIILSFSLLHLPTIYMLWCDTLCCAHNYFVTLSPFLAIHPRMVLYIPQLMAAAVKVTLWMMIYMPFCTIMNGSVPEITLVYEIIQEHASCPADD